ncbi:hypothetical protein [Nocardioides daphniae]|nr:hypothetical protein [Nocardioides daphniae]
MSHSRLLQKALLWVLKAPAKGRDRPPGPRRCTPPRPSPPSWTGSE